jgi:hypothetical protein
MRQGFGLGFDPVVQPFRGRWIFEADDDVNVEQILPSFRLQMSLTTIGLGLLGLR